LDIFEHLQFGLTITRDQLTGFIRRGMAVAGHLDQLATFFCLFPQWHELAHAFVARTASAYAWRRSGGARQAPSRDRSGAVARKRTGSPDRCAWRNAIDRRKWRGAAWSLARQRSGECPLRAGLAGMKTHDRKRKRHQQAADDQGSISGKAQRAFLTCSLT